jgi:Trk-type K+ transport system membrane component
MINFRYLPPYTTFMSFKDERSYNRAENTKPGSMSFFKIANISQISYLAIFVMIICITERDKISQDPLNFNIFSIVFEVVR